MRTVYSALDPVTVSYVQGLLEQAGIESTILNESTGQVAGAVPFFTAAPELWVIHDEDEARARAIIEQYESGTLDPARSRDPWTCPRCGETVDGQFTECWKCTIVDDDDPRRDPDSKCDECGYPLRGLPERRCPECGAEF